MKTPGDIYRQKLIAMCEKAPEYLTLQCHRLLHESDEEGYMYFLKDFLEQIHLIVGKNIPEFCESWASLILSHKEMKPDET